MSGSEAWGILMGAVVFGCATIVLVTLIIQVMATWRARGQLARENEYREIAEVANSVQAANAEQLEKLGSELADVRARLTEIEKLLRDV